MDLMRAWKSDEERLRAAQELRREALVWAKVLVEHSPAAERADPFGLFRCAFADAIDDQWTGRTFDLGTYSGGGPRDLVRLRPEMLAGPSLRSQLERSVPGGKPALGPALRDGGARAVGPDLYVIVASPRSEPTPKLPSGARDSTFFVGALGGEPSPALHDLAVASGGTVTVIRNEVDARRLAAVFCNAYMARASSRAGRLVDPAAAEKYYDVDAMGSSAHERAPWLQPTPQAQPGCVYRNRFADGRGVGAFGDRFGWHDDDY